MYYDIDSIKMKTSCHPMMKLINCSNSNVNMGKIFFYTSWQLFQPGPGEHSCCWLSSLISTTRIMLTHTSTYTENIIIAAFTIDTLILCMKIMSRSELTPDTGHGAEITMTMFQLTTYSVIQGSDTHTSTLRWANSWSWNRYLLTTDMLVQTVS